MRAQESWTLFEQATVEERDWFANLSVTLDQPAAPAAPPNRFRRVHRIAIDRPDGTPPAVYYLKQFDRTQPKNRWRNRLTQPKCDLDATREAMVGEALRARGFATARPVALGTTEAGVSYYLCAELPGHPVRECVQAGRWRTDWDAPLAHWCGQTLRSGVVLTDLSADHVYVTAPEDTAKASTATAAGAPDPGFAVIDLHNGRTMTSTSPPRKSCVRLLRRFAKSVRGLDITRLRAMRFAWRLLRDAKIDAHGRRAILERLPPFDTHGRYDAAGRSTRYRDRNPKRRQREAELLARVWPGGPEDTVLDVPCGAGRLVPVLQPQIARYFGADRSRAMLDQLRERYPDDCDVALADAAEIPLADNAVDGVVVFRFLHHVDDKTAEQVVQEAARVARRFIVVTWFHPVSAHNAKRTLKRLLRLFGSGGSGAQTRYTRSAGTMRHWLSSCGFDRITVAAEARFRRDLWILTAEREGSDTPQAGE